MLPDMAQNPFKDFKVVLLGEGCVGKTSLVLRFCDNRFNENHYSTFQASFLSKTLNIDGSKLNLNIWDTAGQERFHALGPIYYRNSDGAILVYDVTDEDSYLKVKKWVLELRNMLGNETVLCIVGIMEIRQRQQDSLNERSTTQSTNFRTLQVVEADDSRRPSKSTCC